MKTEVKGLDRLIEDIYIAEKIRNKNGATVYFWVAVLLFTAGCFLILFGRGLG